MDKTTHSREYSTQEEKLYMAFELAAKEWKLGFTTGLGQKVRRRKITAGDLMGLDEEIKQAKRRLGLAEEAKVVSCYEAGRDGFWLDRYLRAQGVENLVVDSASIEVNRKAKRAKTDGIDVSKLLTMLIRHDCGEKKVWSVVHVPSVEAEDKRHLHRQLRGFKADRTRHKNRIRGLLVTQGVRMGVGKRFLEKLETVCVGDGTPLPEGLKARLRREYACLEFVGTQIEELMAERADLLRNSSGADIEQVRQLKRLKGIGNESAWLFVMEMFGWRDFHNRREVGGLVGLTPTPHQSGDESHEQGIGKDGITWVRGMAIEIAWGWIRHQPKSELTLWFEKRYADKGKRMRKLGIVAVARKLLIALWRYVAYGEIPAGAQLKA